MKETHAHIDKLVRDRLNELPLAAAPSAGWDALERSLTAAEDMHLRDALTGLAANAKATGWQALESKLDVRSPEDLHLAEQLNELQPAVSAGSWEVLNSRLVRQTDDAVDAIVSDGLARTVPVVASGWAALAARLELVGWRRSTIAAWKVTEGALLLSLILLFVRFSPEAPRVKGPIADLHDGFPLALVASGGPNGGNTAGSQSSTGNPASADRPALVAGEPDLVRSKTDVVKVPRVLPASEVLTWMSDKVEVQGVLLDSGHDPYLPQLVAALEINPLKHKMPLPSPMLHLAEIDNSVPAYYYANGFISPLDVNQVVTQGHTAGEYYDISSERRYTTGFTVGGLLDINKGRNTLQIGIIYSRRAYFPASLEWRYQDYFTPRNPVEGYSEFVYHAIEFPFNYKLTLSENDTWRVSARAGMSLSVIAKPEIKDQDEVVANLEVFEDEVAADGFSTGSSFIPSPGGRVPRQELRTDFSSERNLKDPPRGWFEGGSMLANSSFYLNGGVTVERIMNPRWSIYLSPSIGRVIYLRDGEGVGPYRDRIHLGSLRMGSRYRFGGRK